VKKVKFEKTLAIKEELFKNSGTRQIAIFDMGFQKKQHKKSI
jgi:hypothetical protein